MENEIVAGVLKVLQQEGFIANGSISPPDDVKQVLPAGVVASSGGIEPVELAPADEIRVDNPKNIEALKVMRRSTPARVMLGRSGARPKTQSYLSFLADHAAAVDAVFKDVSDEFLTENNLIQVQTVVHDKDEYLMRPDLGKKLSEEAKALINERIEKGRQVQIIVVDGLSSTSIEANVADVLGSLVQGLKNEGLSVGTPFFIKYGRVGVMDDVAPLTNCEVVVELIGERPGLITAESMSAYMAYKPKQGTVEAERTVVSNIHQNGTPPAEAGAHLATIVKKIVDNKVAGVELANILK